MKTINRAFFAVALCAVAMFFSACNKNILPVPDPEGTITLNMRNDGGSSVYFGSLGSQFYINKSNNFYAHLCSIVDCGAVRGLGNVTSVPEKGWTTETAVTPGHGYVVKDLQENYIRLYVVSFMHSASNDGIIGAEVKYQKGWKPAE